MEETVQNKVFPIVIPDPITAARRKDYRKSNSKIALISGEYLLSLGIYMYSIHAHSVSQGIKY